MVGAVLMDLIKWFERIPHDLVLGQGAAYGLNFNDLIVILPYLLPTYFNSHILRHNIPSSLLDIISGAPQSSTAGPIFFNISINDLFIYFIENASAHNFADGNM